MQKVVLLGSTGSVGKSSLEVIEKNKDEYEKIIDSATDQIENFVQKVNLENPIQ